jgi:WD40 repeat protein
VIQCALAVLLWLSFSSIAQMPAEPVLRIEPGMDTGTIWRIATDREGRWVATASEDKTVRIWELPAGTLRNVLRPPIGSGNEGKLYALDVSPDGTKVAAAGWTTAGDRDQGAYLFDRASGRLLRRLTGAPNVIKHLGFSPDGRWLAAALGAGHGVMIWSLASDQPALHSPSYGADSLQLDWAPDGRLVTSALDGQIRLYRIVESQLVELAKVTAPGGRQPVGVSFAPGGNQIAIAYADSPKVDVLDGLTLQRVFSAETRDLGAQPLVNVAWAADGRSLYAAGAAGRQGRRIVRHWPDEGRGSPRDTLTLADSVMGLAALPQGGLLVAGAGPEWGEVGEDERWRPLGVRASLDFRDSASSGALLVSADARALQFPSTAGGREPWRFDLANRLLHPGADAGLRAALTKALPVSDWAGTSHPRLGSKPLPLQAGETAFSLAVKPDARGFALGTQWSLRQFDALGQLVWSQSAPAPVWAVNIPARGNIVVAAYGDGTLRWHRQADGEELLALFIHADHRRWVLWTPSGYYDASPGGEELIGWHLNRGPADSADFFPVARFRERFNRPDVIDQILETLDEDVAVTRADAARSVKAVPPVSLVEALPPVVELLSPAELTTGRPQVTLRYRSRTAADAPVLSVRVRVNGQARGLPAAPSGAVAPDGAVEMLVDVPSQDCVVELFAENRHGTSTPAVTRVRWAAPPVAIVAAPPAAVPPAPPPTAAPPATLPLAPPPTPAAPATVPASTAAAAVAPPTARILPKLFLLAVGVGTYQNPPIPRLVSAPRDAQDVTQAFASQQGKLYGEVVTRTLTDADARRDKVLEGLDWLRSSVTQYDVGVLLLVGQGLNDPGLGYRFLPWDADMRQLRRTAISLAEIRNSMANLSGVSILFLDTSHAGRVAGAGNSTAAARLSFDSDITPVINDLASPENGVLVFSAGTGRQKVQDDPTAANGAFARALVEGLSGKADPAHLGRITPRSLERYLGERVRALTGGQQTPVAQAPGGVPDFPLALVAP